MGAAAQKVNQNLPNLGVVDEFEATERGTGGFGSSGRH